ncbi:hypothetical protein [Burkholderia vietnamiensis]|uniref:hypothetical protein n=1 Tax=Burkholderia vietnamiensis TaxID=60552 RepID=UPI001CF5C78F|nr:hypothetical protein [Burkholderia vietnamiensis]MCA8290016.1 hypothetical protein [Burkholderia vietnamiensis]
MAERNAAQARVSKDQANMMPTWAVITAWIAGIASVAGVLANIGKVVSAIAQAFAWCRARLGGKEQAPGLPKRTVVAIQEPRINALWWSLGSMGDKPMLQVVGDFNTTNVWTDNVRLAGALIRYRRWGILSRTERGDTMVKDLRSQYSGNYPIPPNHMTHVRVSFHFVLGHREPGKRFKADVAIIDQFDNRHWLKGLTFKSVNAMF